ncbi:MAG: hypothetical protein ACOCXJ_04665, partial [Planctomycetota bacterium]
MAHPLAGSTVVLEFPDLPPHLQALVDEDPGRHPCASLWLPPDWNGARLPLLFWLPGAGGGDGRTCAAGRALIGSASWAVCSLPLFKEQLAPPDGDPDQYWERMALVPADRRLLAGCWAAMLHRIERLLPEHDRQRSWLAGFSNGAHAIALLADEREPDLSTWAANLLLVEGGDDLRNAGRFDGRVLLVQGEDRTDHRDWLRPCAERARAAGADCTLIG